MREELKDILLMGLGAMSLTSDKAKELKEELLKEGTKVYEEGKVKNEELKRHIKENLICAKEDEVTKEDIVKRIKTMSKQEREELLALLNSYGGEKRGKEVKMAKEKKCNE